MTRTWDIARTFALKDLRIAWSYRLSFVLGIGATLYGLVSFRFISKVVGHGGVVGSADDYFRFVVVGLALSGVLRAATESASDNARRDQVEGTLEILATQPVSVTALGLAWSAWPVFEAIVDGALTLVLAIPLGFAVSPNWPAALLVLVLSATVFISIGFVGAAAVLAFQQGGKQITSIALVAMTLVSGAVFPTSVLPDWLHVLTVISPLTYALDAMRAAIVDGDSLTHIGGDLLVLVGVTAAALPLSAAVLSAAFAFARRRGSLARF
jgi:ABC-2 type transport system permease protein